MEVPAVIWLVQAVECVDQCVELVARQADVNVTPSDS